MKQLHILAAFFVFFGYTLALAPYAPAEDADQAVIRVDGLACPFCAYGLEKKLGKMNGVTNYDADLKTGKVMINLSKDARLDEGDIQKAVKEAGFTFKGLELMKNGKVVQKSDG